MKSNAVQAALEAFDAAQRETSHGPRLEQVRRAARAVRQALLDAAPVLSVRTYPLSRVPYPTRYAFQGAALTPVPLIQMEHRCLMIQFRQDDLLRTLLFNPSDIVAARATPFFADLIRVIGPFERFLAPPSKPLSEQLELKPEEIDYLAFDHFHTQDLRPLLGAPGRPARFPSSTLLAPRTEWNDWDQLHPMQRAWYIADGKRGVPEERVRLFDGSLQLGDGVVLLQTPGHTSGNQTLIVRTADGIFGSSENGTCADNWSPHASRMPGLRSFAKKFDLEVLINSNTPELGAAQYTSMIAEREIVDRVAEAPEFVRMLPSSEVARSRLAPGSAPTWRHGGVRVGDVLRPAPQRAVAAPVKTRPLMERIVQA